MDEILASIRRIISEDDALIAPVEHASAPPIDTGEGVLLLTRRAPPAVSVAGDFVPPPPPPAPKGEAQVPEPEPEPEQAPEPEPETPPAELPPEIPPPSPEPEIQSGAPAPAAPSLGQPEPEVTTIDTPLEAEGPPARPETPVPPTEPVLAAAPVAAPASLALSSEDLGLVANDIAVSAAAAFQELHFVIENTPTPPSVSVSAAGPTLEDITRDLLRPMLKAWLDENLPHIVRARVDEEVERIARRGVR